MVEWARKASVALAMCATLLACSVTRHVNDCAGTNSWQGLGYFNLATWFESAFYPDVLCGGAQSLFGVEVLQAEAKYRAEEDAKLQAAYNADEARRRALLHLCAMNWEIACMQLTNEDIKTFLGSQE